MTRAARRAQAVEEEQQIHEDPELSNENEESCTPEEPDRAALRDITDENYPRADSPTETEAAKLMKKTRARKKGKDYSSDQVQEDLESEQGLIQPETTTTEPSLDVEDAEEPQIQTPVKIDQHHEESTTASNSAQTSEPSREVIEHFIPEYLVTPARQKSVISKTPKFDPEVHAESKSSDEVVDDSFVESIKSRSTNGMRESVPEPDQASLVVPVISRTPARSPPRIEDSVEAIDALEDAIEQIAEELPNIQDLEKPSLPKTTKVPASTSKARRETALDTTLIKSPTKAKTPASKLKSNTRIAPIRTSSGRVSAVMPTRKAPTIAKGSARPSTVAAKGLSSDRSGSSPMEPAKSQPNVTKKRVDVTKLSTSKAAFVPAKSTKPVTASTFTLPGEAVAAKLKAQREERLKMEAVQGRKASDPVSKAPTVKSTKPVTTSSFALPGEAVAAKLKAKREERTKKEDVPEEPIKVFKARPAPKTSRPSVVPKLNKTSQARMSMMTSTSNKENVAPTENSTPPVPKQRADATKPNSSARRVTSFNKPTPAPRVSSLTLGRKSIVTKDDAAQQKIRGKEVVGRVKAQIEQAEKERKEKEEAARNARVAAAEKGRQASREWAEKQKKKLMAPAVSKAAIATS